MTDTTLPADWAIERALAEANFDHISLDDVRGHPHSYRLIVAFARRIEKHDQPPVDPWTLQARELAAEVANELCAGSFRDVYLGGGYDDDPAPPAIATMPMTAAPMHEISLPPEMKGMVIGGEDA